MTPEMRAEIAELVLRVADLRRMLDNYPDDAEIHVITDWTVNQGGSIAAVIATYESAFGPNDDGMPYNPGCKVMMLEPYGADDEHRGDRDDTTHGTRS